MIIIPAIDLKNGHCVRLSQGRMEDATVYSPDPVEVARRWESMGAQRLHIVDLDGAMSGKPENKSLIRRICSSVSMKVELGGGIRDIKTIKEYLSAGVSHVILGTAALKNPDFLAESCTQFPGKIIIGIDAHDGMIAVQGWTETTGVRAVAFAKTLDSTAVAAIVFTDISRDGMLTGPNIESTTELAKSVSIPVIASGGMSSLDDIKKLIAVENAGIMGIIIGRALYTGNIDLKTCIALAQKSI